MIRSDFQNIPIDNSWAFHGAGRKDTNYATHGYHSYPAKFIPHIARRLILDHTEEGETVLDPFAGCGTTLVEAKINGRASIGIDVNPVAALITKAKCAPLSVSALRQTYADLAESCENYSENGHVETPDHDRIDYWFREEEKRKLAFLLDKIRALSRKDKRLFFLCAFSNILKSCSIWAQRSNKPIRDFDKIPADPFRAFHKQVKKMLRGVEEFRGVLPRQGDENIPSKIICGDARSCEKVADESAHLVVTSPPYVTSYEYADLHQLSSLWLGYSEDLREFRRDFVGTASASTTLNLAEDDPASAIARALYEKDKKMARSVAAYFSDMKCIFMQMRRALKRGGKLCVVIGNTKLKGVEIRNAEIFCSYLETIGMPIVHVIKREIPSKNLPSVRDPKTGRFTSAKAQGKVMAYPFEYILIAEKV